MWNIIFVLCIPALVWEYYFSCELKSSDYFCHLSLCEMKKHYFRQIKILFVICFYS